MVIGAWGRSLEQELSSGQSNFASIQRIWTITSDALDSSNAQERMCWPHSTGQATIKEMRFKYWFVFSHSLL